MDFKSAGTLVQQGIPALLPLPNTLFNNSICIDRIERVKEAKKVDKITMCEDGGVESLI